MTSLRELDRIERQLAVALSRATDLGWLDPRSHHGPVDELEPVHPSPVYAELERLSAGEDRPCS